MISAELDERISNLVLIERPHRRTVVHIDGTRNQIIWARKYRDIIVSNLEDGKVLLQIKRPKLGCFWSLAANENLIAAVYEHQEVPSHPSIIVYDRHSATEQFRFPLNGLSFQVYLTQDNNYLAFIYNNTIHVMNLLTFARKIDKSHSSTYSEIGYNKCIVYHHIDYNPQLRRYIFADVHILLFSLLVNSLN